MMATGEIRHVLALPAAVSGLGRRKPRARPEVLCSPLASVTRPCFYIERLSVPEPVTGETVSAFLPRPGLAGKSFRHSRVSGKRSQTLNSLGGKT